MDREDIEDWFSEFGWIVGCTIIIALLVIAALFISNHYQFDPQRHVCEEWEAEVQCFGDAKCSINFNRDFCDRIDEENGVCYIDDLKIRVDEESFLGGSGRCISFRDKTPCEKNPSDTENCKCLEENREAFERAAAYHRSCVNRTPWKGETQCTLEAANEIDFENYCKTAREKTECEKGNPGYLLDGRCPKEDIVHGENQIFCTSGWEEICREKEIIDLSCEELRENYPRIFCPIWQFPCNVFDERDELLFEYIDRCGE